MVDGAIHAVASLILLWTFDNPNETMTNQNGHESHAHYGPQNGLSWVISEIHVRQTYWCKQVDTLWFNKLQTANAKSPEDSLKLQ